LCQFSALQFALGQYLLVRCAHLLGQSTATTNVRGSVRCLRRDAPLHGVLFVRSGSTGCTSVSRLFTARRQAGLGELEWSHCTLFGNILRVEAIAAAGRVKRKPLRHFW
jgi:hypothetical protein